MNVEKAIDSRFSCRDFNTKKVRWDKVIEAIDAALKAPLAGKINNMKFIIIEDKNTIEEVAYHCQQDWINDASVVVVVCADESKMENLYHERGKIYSRQQVGAAIQNFLLRITEMGFASCWVGAYADELVKQTLDIPEHIHVEAILPIGKARSKPKKTKSHSLETSMFWGKWGIPNKPNYWSS